MNHPNAPGRDASGGEVLVPDGHAAWQPGPTLSWRLMLVDDHRFYRSAMARALDREPDLVVVAEASSVAEANDLLRTLGCSIDLALLDLHLPDGSGIDLIASFQATCPESRVLVVAGSLDDREMANALEAGAIGYLNKSATLEELITAIRRAASGEALIQPSEVLQVMRAARRDPARSRPDGHQFEPLTERERQVLAAMAEGMTDREMAQRLCISPATVHTHVTSVLGKLGAHSRAQAIVAGLRAGLVELS